MPRSGHGRPTSRRDFLARGLIGGVSTVFLPSIATILAREVYAQTGLRRSTTAATLGAGKIPFLAIDQGGGANIAGSNVIVGKAGGQELFLDPAGYAKLGLPAAILPQTIGVDRTFGLALHPRGALLRGLMRKTSAGTRANTNGFVMPGAVGERHRQQSAQPVYGIAPSRRERRVRRDDRHDQLGVGRQLGRTGRDDPTRTCARRRSAPGRRRWASSAAERPAFRKAASRRRRGRDQRAQARQDHRDAGDQGPRAVRLHEDDRGAQHAGHARAVSTRTSTRSCRRSSRHGAHAERATSARRRPR